MQIFNETLSAWRAVRRALPQDTTLGFVPTMGNLHAGHLALIQQSLHENKKTLVTLFVNPTQFNQTTDFDNYPRTIEADMAKLQAAGVDYCLIPNQAELYHDNYRYQLDETEQSLTMEGTHRPGHFKGVLTVVMKLFGLVQPTRAYFGEKDYQQLTLIQGMIDAFFLDITLCACPTFRAPSGLALSSRNNRLSPAGIEQADRFAKIFHAASSCEQAITSLRSIGLEVEYIEEHAGRRFAAVHVESVRLIDNYALKKTLSFGSEQLMLKE